MLISDVIGVRKLFETSPRNYYFGYVKLVPDKDVLLPPFTGKVVKSLLIQANPSIEEVFSGRYTPKPIHVSTLIRIDGSSRRVYLWKRYGSKQELTMRLGTGQTTMFYIGFTEDIAHKVINALMNLNDIELFNAKWSLIEYGVEKYSLPAEHIPGQFSIDNAVAIKVEFRTPTLLLDPYKTSKYKRFLPLPGIVFSYNVGDLLRMERNRDYIETINLLNAVLNETYSALETVKPIMYIYEGKGYPAITGYIKYMIDWDLVEKTGAQKLLENIIVHASIMGVGTSRANGFGHVTIKIIRE